jgi:septal ring factor EnvC (AmiA/AmiB activator)
METQALRRLEHGVESLLEAHKRSLERQTQLSAALAKTREDLERARAEVEKFRRERSDTRRKIDTLLKRFDSLSVDWGRVDA